MTRTGNLTWSAATLAVALLSPAPLRAQEEAPETPTADETSEPEDADSSGDTGVSERARTHFKAGVNLLQDPGGAKYEEAYQQFKAAYADSPHWKILGNLGLCAMQLERYGEAIEAFTGYLEGGGDDLAPEDRAQFERDLETLKASVATIVLSGPAGSEIEDVRRSNEGRDIRNYYVLPESGELSIGVRPGRHEFTATAGQTKLGVWNARVESLASLEHTFSVEAEKTAPTTESAAEKKGSSSRIPAYAAFGVGAVGVGVGAVFLGVRGGHNKKAQDEYDGCLDSGDCGSTEQSSIEGRDEKAATAGTVSLVSFGVGAVGIGAGIALLFLDTSGNKTSLEADVGQVKVRPYAGLGQLGLTGKF